VISSIVFAYKLLLGETLCEQYFVSSCIAMKFEIFVCFCINDLLCDLFDIIDCLLGCGTLYRAKAAYIY